MNEETIKIPLVKATYEELQEENGILRKNIYNAKEFIEKHRIREMSMVEVNVLEGILNER